MFQTTNQLLFWILSFGYQSIEGHRPNDFWAFGHLNGTRSLTKPPTFHQAFQWSWSGYIYIDELKSV
jgi:pyruvate-formate lyase